MKHQLPQPLPECDYTHFCDQCRIKDSGRAFRKTILQVRGIEGVHPDFDCPKGKPWKSRGLGDTIAKVTSAVGIKPCGGCKKRQAKLNKLIPYGKP